MNLFIQEKHSPFRNKIEIINVHSIVYTGYTGVQSQIRERYRDVPEPTL